MNYAPFLWYKKWKIKKCHLFKFNFDILYYDNYPEKENYLKNFILRKLKSLKFYLNKIYI